LNLVIDVSAFIDNFFVYDEEQSDRARSLFKLVTDKDLILIPGMFPPFSYKNSENSKCFFKRWLCIY